MLIFSIFNYTKLIKRLRNFISLIRRSKKKEISLAILYIIDPIFSKYSLTEFRVLVCSLFSNK